MLSASSVCVITPGAKLNNPITARYADAPACPTDAYSAAATRNKIAMINVSETDISFPRISFYPRDPHSRKYMTEYAIDIVNVTKRYAEHTAVRDLTLRVPTGSVYGLLGPNGAGKTTPIRMILNIIAPDAGTIHIFGRPSSDSKIPGRLGHLPEGRGLYRKMQVKRVLKFLAELKGVKGSEAEQRIDDWRGGVSLK